MFVKANREKLVAVMTKSGVSAREISNTTGIHLATVYNVLEGRSVRFPTLSAVARALGVKPTEIMEGASGGKEAHN